LIVSGMLVAQPARASTDGIVSVTPITQVSTWGQRVTAVALEFEAPVDPASVSPDAFLVEDTSFNFRFDSADALANMVERDVARVYTNSVPGLRTDGTSMEGNYLVLELSDDSPGGYTISPSTGFMSIRINPAQPTRVFQLADVLGLDGSTLSSARPDFAWTLTKPAVNLEVDEFEHAVFTSSTGNVLYDYRLPEGYDPADEYPVVVILPGYGMGYDGQNERVEIVADIPATAWFQPEWTGTDEKVIVLAIQTKRTSPTTEAAQSIELIESFSDRFAVDPDRVYMSSVSWGSRLLWQMAATRPELFAGALLTGGFAATTSQLTAIAEGEVPFWITHGTHDGLLPVASARGSYQTLVAAYEARGLDEAAIARLVHWTEFGDEWYSMPDYHAVNGPTYEDESILQWLLAQDRSVDLTEGDGVKVSTEMAAEGGLAMRLAESSVDLGALALDSSLEFLGAQGDLPAFTVADTRSTDPGWSLTVASSDFRSENNYTIAAKHLGLTPAVLSTSEGQAVAPGDEVAPGAGFASGATLAKAEAGEGRGTATVGGTLVLNAPTTTHEGSYVTWVTVTLL